MNKKFFLFFLFFLVLTPSVFAEIIIVKPSGTININSSDFWDDLDVPTDIPNSEYWYNLTTGAINIADNKYFQNDSNINITTINSIGINPNSPTSIVFAPSDGLTSSELLYTYTAGAGWGLSNPVIGGKVLSVLGSASVNQDVLTTSNVTYHNASLTGELGVNGSMSVGDDVGIASNRLINAGVTFTDTANTIFAFRFKPIVDIPTDTESTKIIYGIGLYPTTKGEPTYYGGAIGMFLQPIFDHDTGFVFNAQGLSVLLRQIGAGTISTLVGVDIVDVSKGGGSGAITTQYGIRVLEQTQGNTNWQILSTAGDWAMDGDGDKFYVGEEQDASFEWDGTNMVFDTNITSPYTGIAWFSNNVSANYVVERGSTYDRETAGNPFDYIKNSSHYKKADGTRNYSSFFGYTAYQVKNESNCSQELDRREYCYEGAEGVFCFEQQTNLTEKGYKETMREYMREVCGTKTEEGVIYHKETDLNRQGIFELKQENDLLKDELCLKDITYSWCKK